MTVQARQHSFISDAGLSETGTDQGPTPHELLAGALAACTSMTVQMYANRKGWPLTSADATVRIGQNGGVSVFEVTLSLSGTLPEESRTRLLEIAGRCPVHKILTGSIKVNVTLV